MNKSSEKPVLLTARGLAKHFGGITALSGYHVSIGSGELVGLIGPNGAGKTTVFNLLSGVLKPSKGNIFFEDKDITGQKPHQKTSLGIARTFQNIRLFKELSVIDNIKVAFHSRLGKGFWQTLFHTPGYLRSEHEMEARCDKLLDLFGLQKVRNLSARKLPYGIQRRLEIARAMATRPKLLLLDEPSAGLNPRETEDIMGILGKIHDRGITIFLVEHDMKLVMNLCQKIQVLGKGGVITMGTPQEVRGNPKVVEAYLGKSHGGAING